MPKAALPYRIRYEWVGTGVTDTRTRRTEANALDLVAQLRRAADRRGMPITIIVQHRDQPEPVLVVTHQPAKVV
jgi:hypothetical protein